MESVSIVIGGDLGPTRSNFSHFSSGRLSDVIDSQILSLLASADFRIFNLEIPLTDEQNPISKDGPCLSAPTETFKGIVSLKPSLFTLANNHIMDHGDSGFKDTISILKENNICFVGAGKNLSEALRPVILEKNGRKVGVYGCAENEFSIAGTSKAGANPFDPLESLDHINRLKAECDYLIVLHHGGKERYRLPSPELQRVCRKMIGHGADLVVCQHSHSVGCFEQYGEGTIVYGQGNFLFDRHDDEFYQTGLLIKIEIDSNIEVSYIPIRKRKNGVDLADQNAGEKILKDFYERTKAIQNPSFIEEEFDKYCEDNGQYYLATLAGFGKTLRRIDKVLKRPFTRAIYSEAKLNTIRNHFECETHREILLRYIKILNMGKKR